MASAIEVNVQEIETLAKQLNGYALSASQAKQLLQTLGLEIAEQTQDRFDTGRDPDGNQWKALSEAYAKQKIKDSDGGILVREGDLRKIVLHVKNSASVLVGSCAEYADAHQNPKNKSRRRAFLGLSKDNISELSDMIDLFIQGGAHG